MDAFNYDNKFKEKNIVQIFKNHTYTTEKAPFKAIQDIKSSLYYMMLYTIICIQIFICICCIRLTFQYSYHIKTEDKNYIKRTHFFLVGVATQIASATGPSQNAKLIQPTNQRSGAVRTRSSSQSGQCK